MVLKIVNKSNNQLPRYETLLSAGMDVRAFIDNPKVIAPLERTLIKTGLYVEMEQGY